MHLDRTVEKQGPHSARFLPLVVDLDGTLLRSDLLIETAFSELRRRPLSLFAIVTAICRGKAALKHRLAGSVDFDPSMLPYDSAVLERVQRAAAEGRAVYLASASNERLVEAVARYIGSFDGWFASNATINLKGEAKARRLVDAFGERCFDYIGNDATDLAVWAHAATAITVRTSSRVARRLAAVARDVEHLPTPKPGLWTWLRMVRVHQYAKNALVFVPLLTAHKFEIGAAGLTALAALAFSLCASSVYILNDLADLQADRTHPTKRDRPLASGAIPLQNGLGVMSILFVASLLVAAYVSLPFLGVLLGYFALTTAYSFFLKRKMLVDVVALAMLYSIRVIGGAIAAGVVVSEWLLAFSMFIFMSLALIKRYVELSIRFDTGMPDPSDRNYSTGDLSVIAALAAAAGFNAVTVFALYVSTDTVNGLYSRPEILWLVCPVLMYWIGRCLMMAHRRFMDDDPIVFALKDKRSLLAIAVIGALVLAAI